MTYQLRNKKLYPQPEVDVSFVYPHYAEPAFVAHQSYLTTVIEASDDLLKLYKDGDMIEEGEIEINALCCTYSYKYSWCDRQCDNNARRQAFPKQPIQRSESQEELWKEFYWGAPSAENNPNYAWAVSHYEIKRKHPNTSP